MAQHGYLDYEQRKQFQALYRKGAQVNRLAEQFSVSPATVYREIQRGTDGKIDRNGRLSYSAKKAQDVFIKSLHRRAKKTK